LLLLLFASLAVIPFIKHEAYNTAFDSSDVVCLDREGNRYAFSSVGRQTYLFLSSSLADEDVCSLLLAEDYEGPTVTLNGIPMLPGKETHFAFTEETLTLSFQAGVSSFSAVAVRSEGVPMLCINTSSGNMNFVHADKNNKESGTLRLTDETGALLLESDLTYIKGRGNQTWRNEKKPYNIKLTEKASLLGMESAREWCLLADYSDLSVLRNKLVYDLAGRMDFAYSPSCEYVDLWLNGEYAGLYLLAEKVEIKKNRLAIYDLENATEAVNENELSSYPVIETEFYRCYDIPNNPENITEGYVIELENAERLRDSSSWFMLDDGTCFALKSPECVSEEQMLYLRGFVQGMYHCLTSSTGRDRATGKVLTDYADAASFVQKYLLEEIAGNMDSEWSSQYFYLSGGKLYAGPCWDYDHSLGNGGFPLSNPETLIATWRSRYLNTDLWYTRLLSYPGFFDLVCLTYEKDVRPLLDEMLAEYDELRAQTEQAVKMNALRWRIENENDELLREQAELLDYLCKRIDFLDRYWIDREELICVSFVGGGYERLSSVMVKSGTSLSEIADTGLGVTVQNAVLINKATNTVVLDLTEPLYEDSVFALRGD